MNDFKIASYNVQTKLGKNSPNIYTLTKIAKNKKIDVICLQEVGRVSSVINEDPRMLNGYTLKVSADGKCTLHLVSLLRGD